MIMQNAKCKMITQNGKLQSTVGCNSLRYPQVWDYKPKKKSFKLYFDMIFIPDLGHNFWEIFFLKSSLLSGFGLSLQNR